MLDFTQKGVVSGLLMKHLDYAMAHSYDIADGFNEDDLNRLVEADETFEAVPYDADGEDRKKKARAAATVTAQKLVDDCAKRLKEEAKARIAAGEKPPVSESVE